jgi:hypothetical protein
VQLVGYEVTGFGQQLRLLDFLTHHLHLLVTSGEELGGLTGLTFEQPHTPLLQVVMVFALEFLVHRQTLREHHPDDLIYRQPVLNNFRDLGPDFCLMLSLVPPLVLLLSLDLREDVFEGLAVLIGGGQ